MTASLLHELRDPVFALRARLQLARAGLEPGPDALAGLQASVDDIEALLAFYGGLGGAGLEALPVDVGGELRAASTVLQARARRRQVRLDIGPVEVGLLVVVRPVTVRQVLMNLTNNALDAVADGGGSRVQVSARRDQDQVVLCVDDDGPGWPAAAERLVEPWFSTKGDGGSGLGLYLARLLLDEAGGSLSLETAPRGGARAVARWPSA